MVITFYPFGIFSGKSMTRAGPRGSTAGGTIFRLELAGGGGQLEWFPN